MLISHDRTFLDSVINNVISFDNGGLKVYKGNYSSYERQRAERMALQQALYEKQQRRKSEIESFVRRFKAKATKAKQAQSRLKELNRMQDIAPAHVDSPFRFQFPKIDEPSSYLMQMDALSIGFDAPLVEKIELSVSSESRFGLLGFNGSGKSTLLKVLAGQMQQLGGDIIRSKKLKIGYFAQHQVDELDQLATPIQLIQKEEGNATEQQIRDYLGGFDFRGTRVNETIKNFSGGEKARLALAKVAWQKPNLLLLDEPTNHLDLEMCHALTVALQQYQGAMLVVSHDRHLLVNTVDEFHSIHKGVFAEFKGDLKDYEKWLSTQSFAAYEENEAQAKNATSAAPKPKLDKKEKRQQAADHREKLGPLKKQEKSLEAQIDKLQKRLVTIESSLADEAMYLEENKIELNALIQEQGALKSQLNAAEEQWMEVLEEVGSYS